MTRIFVGHFGTKEKKSARMLGNDEAVLTHACTQNVSKMNIYCKTTKENIMANV